MIVIRNRVSDLGIRHGLDVGVEVAHLARRELLRGNRLGRLIAQALHFEHLSLRPQADLLAHADAPVDHLHQDDGAAILIEPGIKNERAQRIVRRTFRGRHALDDRLQRFMNADSLLGAHQQGVSRIQADYLFNLFADALRLGGG